MATYTPDQYQKVWRSRATRLRKSGNNTARDAAMYMEASAKGMAPIKSGDLRAGITSKKLKSGQYEVSSKVPGNFPYNFWINQTAPFRTIRAVWNNSSPTVYGDGSHINTGTPRFWHFATIRTRDMFKRLAVKNTRKVFKTTIG